MGYYSIATTKDKLSSLVDKAMAGEEVIITRHGKPVAEINVTRQVAPSKLDRTAAVERLRKLRETQPAPETPIPLHRFYDWLYEDEER